MFQSQTQNITNPKARHQNDQFQRVIQQGLIDKQARIIIRRSIKSEKNKAGRSQAENGGPENKVENHNPGNTKSQLFCTAS